MTTILTKPTLHEFIIPFERNVKSKCQICSEAFGMIKREHLCKRCYRIVCDECSPFKVKCYTPDYKNKLHRMCRNCNVESQLLMKYVKSNHLQFGEDSDVVKLWLKQLGLRSIPKRRTNDKNKMVDITTFMQVWKSLNFSFRQFIGIVIDQTKISIQQVGILINSALTEIGQNKLSDLQHTIYIVLFFLAHSNITSSIYFTSLLLQTINPPYEQKMQSIPYFLQEMQCTEIQVYKMQNLLEEMLQKISKRATVNVFTAQITIEIINALISKRNIEELEKGIAFVFSKRKQFICMNANKPEDVYLDIIRNIDCSNYRKIVKGLSDNRLCDSPDKSQSMSQNSYNSKSLESSPKYVALFKQNKQLKQKVTYQQKTINELKEQNQRLKRHPEKKISQQIFNDSQDTHRWRDSLDQDAKDVYSTDPSGDQSVYNSILRRKNEEIAKIKNEMSSLKKTIKQLEEYKHSNVNDDNLGSSNSGLNVSTTTSNALSRELKQKQEELIQSKSENEGLKNINKRLLMKMHELSNLLMDKQQKNISQSNKKFNNLMQKYDSLGEQQMKKQCSIF